MMFIIMQFILSFVTSFLLGPHCTATHPQIASVYFKCGLLGCETMQYYRWTSKFQKNMSCPLHGQSARLAGVSEEHAVTIFRVYVKFSR